MAPPTPRTLLKAILSNDSDAVKQCLDDGADPNARFSTYSIPRLDENISSIGSLVRFVRNRDNSLEISPLHVSVLNCYHNYDIDKSAGNQALEIFYELMKRNADTEALCPGGIVVTNVGNRKWKIFQHDDHERTTPLHFVCFLKQNTITGRYEEQNEILDILKEELKKPRSAAKVGQRELPTMKILQSVGNTYDELLLSEEFSDVKFSCSDGEVLHAHRNILAASSPYFRAAFRGPWSENDNGVWTTAHPSGTMKAVLAMIYKGETDSALFGLHPLELLSVASEFQLPPLLMAAEDACVQRLDTSNVKEILQASYLHNNAVLKRACFQFVRANAAELMVNTKMMALAGEQPELWAELARNISPQANDEKREKKRARLN